MSNFKSKLLPFHHQQLQETTLGKTIKSLPDMVTTVCFVIELLLMITASLSLRAALPVFSQSMRDSPTTAA